MANIVLYIRHHQMLLQEVDMLQQQRNGKKNERIIKLICGISVVDPSHKYVA